MRVVIQQIDLDTCLAALVLGVTETDDIVVAADQAPVAELRDPAVLCIEAGGSGQVELNNFDHHAPGGPVEPACQQALAQRGGGPEVQRLVDYVSAVDTAPARLPRIPFPSLSAVFSGLRLVEPDSRLQLLLGLALLHSVLDQTLDPFSQMPLHPEWGRYVAAKVANMAALNEAAAHATFRRSAAGRRVGALETDALGALGCLYELGCAIGIACHPALCEPPLRKITIGGNGVQVGALRRHLALLEPGWGGPASGTILGSPRSGTQLDLGMLVTLVCKAL